jgi:DNA polymerase
MNLFEGTSGPHRARIAIVGEAWGSEEASAKRPFVGSSGQLLNQILGEAGILRDDCFASNLVCARPPGNEMWQFFEPRKGCPNEPFWGLDPGPAVHEGLQKLSRELALVDPELIILTGNYPFWAFSSEARTRNGGKKTEGRHIPTGIGDFRGSMLLADRTWLECPVLPIMHPAAILREWSWRATTVQDLKTRVPKALAKRWAAPPVQLTINPTFEQTMEFFDGIDRDLLDAPVWLAVDIETRRRSFITCVGLCCDPKRAFCLPFIRQSSSGELGSYWPPEQECTIVRRMAHALTHPGIRIIGQNFNYDRQFFYDHWRLRLPCAHDTLQAQHLLLPGTPKDLGHLSSLYCSHHRYWKDDGKDWDAKGTLDSHFTYNAEDALRTREIALLQRPLIVSEGLSALWAEEMEKVQLAFKMMLRGILVNRPERAAIALNLMELADARTQRLMAIVPQSLVDPEAKTPWFNSPLQQQKLFYDLLGLPTQRHKKTGEASLDKTSLAALKEKAGLWTPLFELLEELRSIGVLRATFIEAPLDPDGRMRCFFNTAGTYTFRWSSSENAFGRGTNLQNIPKEKNL